TQQKPKLEWLDYVVTTKARSKIKASLNSDKRKIADEGKEILQRKLRHLKVDFSENTINQLQQYFKLSSSMDVFYNIAVGIIDNNDLRKFADRNSGFTGLINRFRKSTFNTAKKEEFVQDKTKLDSLVFGNDEERLDYELASCCNPIPGDKVFGFITVSKGIKVHKVDCPNSVSLQANYAYRIIKAKWIDSSQREFKALIELHGLDRAGMVSDITLVISKNNSLNMHSINLSEDAGIFDGKITVSVKNKAELEKIMLELKNIEGIQSVKRTYKN
ncbi:MAG: ACT domain-containing protein, partial [Algoriella sp.]